MGRTLYVRAPRPDRGWERFAWYCVECLLSLEEKSVKYSLGYYPRMDPETEHVFELEPECCGQCCHLCGRSRDEH